MKKFPSQYPYIVEKIMGNTKKNDHQRKKAWIFYKILSNIISPQKLHMDIGAWTVLNQY